MKEKILSYISYSTLIAGAAIGAYVFSDMYFFKNRLLAGVCPVTNNKQLIYIAIVLYVVISFILSFFEPEKSDTKK